MTARSVLICEADLCYKKLVTIVWIVALLILKHDAAYEREWRMVAIMFPVSGEREEAASTMSCVAAWKTSRKRSPPKSCIVDCIIRSSEGIFA